MKMFNVRIELLHNADGRDYEQLHARMRARGFSTTIVGVAGRAHLPPAEYLYHCDGTAVTVRDLAHQVASSGLRLGLSLRVYVIEVANWASKGLAAA